MRKWCGSLSLHRSIHNKRVQRGEVVPRFNSGRITRFPTAVTLILAAAGSKCFFQLVNERYYSLGLSIHDMISQLPLLLIFLALSPQHTAAISRLHFNPRAGLTTLVSKTWPSRRTTSLKSRSNLNVNPNGSTFLWLPQDEYSGNTFFEYVISSKVVGIHH